MTTISLWRAQEKATRGAIKLRNVETSNPAIPHGHGPIRPGHFIPFAKNPTLSKFFMQMGRGEEIGSGVSNVNKYLPFYTKGGKPRFIEGDPFVTIIPLPSAHGLSGEQMATQMATQKTTQKTGVKTKEKTREKTREKILKLLRATPNLTTAELADDLGITDKGIAWQLTRLCKTGILRRIGPDKGGHWEVVQKQ